ncbi:MAG: tetratricopeptide repeat protein, partial [Calditrichaeota bacterium]|nr:tetratricopeptide repeat protein [Calditrichota bacterium]
MINFEPQTESHNQKSNIKKSMKNLSLQLKSLLFCLLTIFIFSHGVRSQGVIFQAGLYAEEVEGDLNKALYYYQQIVLLYPENRFLAANALLHIGLCYEKLGEEKASQSYQRIVTDYADQLEIAAIARKKLLSLKKPPATNKLVKYYFERLTLDPMTAVSFDGKFFAFTDWTTGNLKIRNLKNRAEEKITNIDWSKTHKFAYHPVWSRDSKHIAYSQYRAINFIELHIVTTFNKKNIVVYSNPKFMIFPHDWTPDGKKILCEIFNNLYSSNPEHYLALISTDGNLEKITQLGSQTRGLKFSPDGKFVAYDLLKWNQRHIFIYNFKDKQEVKITKGKSGYVGFESPIWGPDGKLLLYRSQGRGIPDLWATPIKNGKPFGDSYIVLSDLVGSLLSMKGLGKNHITSSSLNITSNKKENVNFEEEFNSSNLDDAWTVSGWEKTNVYDYQSFGRYSLSDNPGYLRYYLDPAMVPGNAINYMPSFTEWWFWYYPALEISRPIYGRQWVLEARATYSMVDGVNSRVFLFKILFADTKVFDATLSITRG